MCSISQLSNWSRSSKSSYTSSTRLVGLAVLSFWSFLRVMNLMFSTVADLHRHLEEALASHAYYYSGTPASKVYTHVRVATEHVILWTPNWIPSSKIMRLVRSNNISLWCDRHRQVLLQQGELPVDHNISKFNFTAYRIGFRDDPSKSPEGRL